MKTNLLLLLSLCLCSSCVSINRENDRSKYIVLTPTKVDRSSHDWEASGEMAHFESIDVSGYKTARMYLHVYTIDEDRGEPDFWTTSFPKDSYIDIVCYHSIGYEKHKFLVDGVSLEFYSEKLYAAQNGLLPTIQGWIEIPIIGNSMGVRIYGGNMPNSDFYVDGTLYLLEK